MTTDTECHVPSGFASLSPAEMQTIIETSDTTSARSAYTQALACQVSAPERRFLLARIEALG